MDSIVSLLNTLNGLSPLAVIALLGTVIYILVKGKTPTARKVNEITDNHLHDLPSMATDIKDIAETLRRMETKAIEEFSYLKARINGKG